MSRLKDIKVNVIADQPLRAERLSKCLECPHKKKLICGHCGCLLSAKIALKRAKCPINKW